MESGEKVTVDRSYFEALLRRADFHISSQAGEATLTAGNVTIPGAEYDSLLRTSREHFNLKTALFQGGILPETFDLLCSGTDSIDQRKDSGYVETQFQPVARKPWDRGVPGQFQDATWRNDTPLNPAPAGMYQQGRQNNDFGPHGHLGVPGLQRNVSYGMSSNGLEDTAFDDEASMTGGFHSMHNGYVDTNEQRTVFFHGLSDRTTCRDLLNNVKGGKLLNVSLRHNNATVSFLDAASAADFLSWAKRNDIYVLSKRVEVKWADRQFRLNRHTQNKVFNGATRNFVICGAEERGITESSIREDMEHIHSLAIVDVRFKEGNAYVSTNSIPNALFARTCMLSRLPYKGLQIKFTPDECDVPLPVRTFTRQKAKPQKAQKPSFTNRFGALDLDGNDRSSDEENRTPLEDSSDGEHTPVGVSLDFLEPSST